MVSDEDKSGKDKPSAGAGSGAGSGPGAEAGKTGGRRPVTIDLVPEKVEAASQPKAQPAAAQAKPATPATSAAGASSAASSQPKAAETSAAKPAGTPDSGAARAPLPERSNPFSPQGAASSASSSSAASSSAGAASAGPSSAGPASAGATSSGAASATGSPTASSPAGAQPAAASATSSTAKPASSFAGSPSASDKQTPPQGVSFGGAMAAALLVGVALLGGFYTLNQTGVLPLKGNGPLVTEDMLADRARLETLERRFAELAAAEATVAANAAPGSTEGLRELETRLTAMVDSLRGDNQSKLADLAAQLDAVRQGAPQPGPVAGAAAPAATAPADAGAATGLAARVDGLQGSVEAMTSALASVQAAAAASDAALKSLADGQVRDADAVARLTAQLSELTQRGDAAVAELKTAAGEMAARLAAVEEMMGDASAREMAARALSVSALRAAVDAGRPFVTELAAVKAALGDTAAGDMAALEAEAAAGIAPTATLMAQFPPIARAIHATLVQPDPEAGVLDSLLSSAASLIAVRGPGDASGTGPEAALRQMENAVKAGDLAAALVAFDALPEAARGPADGWAKAARARLAVDRLTGETASAVLSAIARKGN